MQKHLLYFLFIGCTILSGTLSKAQTIVSAGKNQLVTGNATSLQGTITGSGSGYEWSVETWPGWPDVTKKPTFSNGGPIIYNTLNPTISGLVTGTYKLKFSGIAQGVSRNHRFVYLYVTGSRGTPAFDIDFGTGTSSQTLSSYLTSIGSSGTTGLNYQHDGTACPNNGFYSILPQTYNTCFDNAWINANDHTTGNGSDRFLIVNANANTSGTYYEQTITNACDGAAYEFSVWVANLNKEGTTNCNSVGGYILPVINFNFYNADNGVLISSKSTGPIPMQTDRESDAWKRYSATVKIPAGVSRLRVNMTSNQGGCGNDFGLDDIQLTPYGQSISLNVTGGSGSGSGATVYERLYGSSFAIEATTQSVRLDDGSTYSLASPVYQWQRKNKFTGNAWVNVDGQTNATYNITNFAKADTGWYRILVASSGNIGEAGCRIISREIYLKGPDEATLPVTLGSFTVTKQNNNQALLKWTTFNEKENAYFEVYRSLNGVDFEQVGIVAGNGTTGLTNTYQFADDITGLEGIIYYRLKDIDFDGRGNFSKIISLRGDNNNPATISVYPNPFTTDIKLTLNNNREQSGTIRLTNITGQVLVSKKILLQRGENIVVLPGLDKLQKGLYVVEFISDEVKIIEKVMKQ
ncbi:T9SS type A sorting domain-containing protein [Terrimonas rubra]|uniref:T9SS type A sorting domain-containing protein n=1 Tax=Terrimonas rubra TaxID=1035890 RepID=A0ABW6A5G0_9BACT